MRKEQTGRTGYYIIVENQPHLTKHLGSTDDYTHKLSPYFESVEYLGIYPLFNSYGKVAKGALIFKGVNYNGNIPEESTLY